MVGSIKIWISFELIDNKNNMVEFSNRVGLNNQMIIVEDSISVLVVTFWEKKEKKTKIVLHCFIHVIHPIA